MSNGHLSSRGHGKLLASSSAKENKRSALTTEKRRSALMAALSSVWRLPGVRGDLPIRAARSYQGLQIFTVLTYISVCFTQLERHLKKYVLVVAFKAVSPARSLSFSSSSSCRLSC